MYSFIQKIILKKNKKGFTLVELLVAAAILVSAMGAPLYVGVRGIIIATEAQNKIAATFLAEEGIELIRNQRDTNLLKIIALDLTVTWDDQWGRINNGADLGYCFVENSGDFGCVVGRNLDDFGSGTILFEKCTVEECRPIQMYELGELREYGYGGGHPDSFFTRIVKVERVSDEEVKVSSMVKWNSRGTDKTITVSEHFFNYGFD